MNPKGISKREKTILVVCVAVVAGAVIYNFALEPIIKKWIATSNQLAAAEYKLRRSTAILKRRREIIGQYQNISTYIKQGEVSDEQKRAFFLGELEKLASSSGARITNIKPRAIREKSYYRQHIVELESEGDISKLTKFIYEIQTSAHFPKIEKLAISMKRGDSNILKVNMVISKFLP